VDIIFHLQEDQKKLSHKLFSEYFKGKQTLKQLSLHYKKSIPWIQKQLDAYEPDLRTISPKVVTIVADATFFGRRSDKLGTLVFKDVLSGKIVASKHIEREHADDYKQLIDELIEKGFRIQGAVVDGKRGVNKAFGDISVQMCHFHQIAIVKRYLTNKPKLEASIDLLKICHKLTFLTQERFEDALNIWHLKYKSFLEEKTLNVKTNRLTPTHARLLSAYRSLKTNLPYLFTYKNHKEFHIPNTTNHLDGGVFSQLKKLIKLHQGLAKKRKVKLIDEFLSQYNQK